MRYIATLIACITLIPLFGNGVTVANITHFGYCGDIPSGAIDLEIEDGLYTPYTYSWGGPGGFVAETQDIDGLYPGVYSVTVTDALCGVTILEDIMIECEGSCPDIMDASIELLSCICESQPSQPFTLTATGTAGPFTFLWSGPNNYTFAEQNPDDITEAGNYTVLVTNAYGCTISLSENLLACPVIQSLAFELIQACSSPSASIFTTVTGGTPGLLGYAYEWSNGQNIPNIINIPVDATYSLTVTDQNGCTIDGSVTVPASPNHPAIVVTADIRPACTPSTGGIDLNITSGTPPYSVQWSLPGAPDQNYIHVLQAGSYRATITDANGCEAIEEYYVPSGPLVSADVTPTTCFERHDGSIVLTILGSNGNTIHWSDGDQYDDLTTRTNLSTDIYSVTVTSSDDVCEFR